MHRLAVALTVTALVGCRRESAPAAPLPGLDAEPIVVPPLPKAAPRGHDADDDCVDCHPREVESYARTAMGRSLHAPGSRTPVEDFSPAAATVVHGQTGLTYRASIDDRGRWWQEESLPGTDFRRRVEVVYVIGSGRRMRSYIGRVNGELVQMPMAWYALRRRWGISPGHDQARPYRFTRPVKPDCLFCHNALTPAAPRTMAGFVEPLPEGIDCSRCHGDGATHVAKRQAGETLPAGASDPWILNPRHLDHRRQVQICEQCHDASASRVLLSNRSWHEYDPRTPLADYMSMYAFEGAHGPQFEVHDVGSRLSSSRCATQSRGALVCTTCHDPHRSGSEAGDRAACLSCHAVEQCGDQSAAAKAEVSCSGCHMGKTNPGDIPHVAMTDHFIRKRPDSRPVGGVEPGLELIDVLAPVREGPDPEALVRRGLAHVDRWRIHGETDHLPLAIRDLTAGLDRAPSRGEAWVELGRGLCRSGRVKEALSAYRRAGALIPDEPLLFLDFAELLEDTGDAKGAERALRTAIALQPRLDLAIGNLANLLAASGRNDQAEAMYERADEITPHNAVNPSNRGINSLRQGDAKAAERWFGVAIARDPMNGMAWFNLARLALEQRDVALAEERLAGAIRAQPTMAIAHLVKGQLEMERGDFVQARGRFERVIELAPSDGEGYVALASVERASGHRAAAQAAIERGLEAAPRHPGLLALRAAP